jgi:hypothetical protein
MKLLYISFVSFCFISSCTSTRRSNISIKNNDCQSILDSARVFVLTGEFAVNTIPTIKDNARNLRLDKWLQKLSFKDFTCLLESNDLSIKSVGFMYAVNFNGDSILKKYSYLLSDTTTVQLFMADGRVSPKMKFGELLSEMSQSIQDQKDNFAKKPEIENIVSAFIKKYSAYPDSYKPISFPFFSMGSDNKGLTDFKIHHDYEIKTNKGEDVHVINAFVLDKNLKINIIEKDSTRYSHSIPPKLDYWLKEFGRKLNKEDSIILRLR